MSARILRVACVGMLAIAGASLAAPLGPPAHAQDLELRIGPDGVRPVIRDRDRERRIRDRGCSPGEARAAALDEGLRRPQVVRVTERTVTVEGYTRRGPELIRFANRRGCPII